MAQPDPRYEKAAEHVKSVRDFLYHLMVFGFVGTLLAVLDVRVPAGDGAIFGLDWAFWVILFWGFGVVGHAIWVFTGDRRIRKVAREDRTGQPV